MTTVTACLTDRGEVRAFPSGVSTHGGAHILSVAFVAYTPGQPLDGLQTSWSVPTEALPVVADELERIADLCRGTYESEQDRLDAERAVEAVADSLRGRMSEALAGDDDVAGADAAPQSPTDIAAEDLALPIAAGGA